MGECRFGDNQMDQHCCYEHKSLAALCTHAAADLEQRLEEAEADRRFGTTIPCNRGTCCGCLIGKKIGKMLIFTCNECAQEAGRAELSKVR